MEDQDHSALSERYHNLPDEEILQLVERRSDLLPSAQVILDREVATRRAKLEVLKHTRADDTAEDLAGQARHLDFKRQREAKRYRWFLIFFIPFLIYSLFTDPVVTLRAIAPAAVVLTLTWSGFFIWRRIAARRSGSSGGDA